MIARPATQAPGIHHRPVGAMLVSALNDGIISAEFAWLAGIPPEQAAALHRAAHRAIPPRITVNAFLVWQADGGLALVDAGAGAALGPELGALPARLASLGVAPGDIDTVLLTHLHPDHAGGLIDAEGNAAFPRARLILHEAEAAFWQAPATEAAATGEQARAFLALARATLAAYAGRIDLLTSASPLPGVTAVPLPGHTPGHTGWRLGTGAEALLIWGDVVHMPGIQFARPEAGMGFDVDPDAARATRAQIMAEAAADGVAVAGMHLDFPAFGHVIAAGAGYAFIPEVWAPLP